MKKKQKPSIDFGELNFSSTYMEPVQIESEKPEPVDSGIAVGIHRLYPSVELPAYSTERSACFDLKAYFGNEVNSVESYTRNLMKWSKNIISVAEKDGLRGISIEPGECAFVPTGIVFEIPEGFKINLLPRSGISAKQHLKLANCVGVIDEDFYHETKVLFFNDSDQRQFVVHGERICQAELVPVWRASFYFQDTRPEKKTSRDGGVGHTGVR